MSHLNRSNGRADPEVIVNVCSSKLLAIQISSQVPELKFADGLSYSKTKLEEAYRNGLLEKPVKPPKVTGVPAKKDDVELIVSSFDVVPHLTLHTARSQVQELEIPKARAEKALVEHHGDVAKALEALILP